MGWNLYLPPIYASLVFTPLGPNNDQVAVFGKKHGLCRTVVGRESDRKIDPLICKTYFVVIFEVVFFDSSQNCVAALIYQSIKFLSHVGQDDDTHEKG